MADEQDSTLEGLGVSVVGAVKRRPIGPSASERARRRGRDEPDDGADHGDDYADEAGSTREARWDEEYECEEHEQDDIGHERGRERGAHRSSPRPRGRVERRRSSKKRRVVSFSSALALGLLAFAGVVAAVGFGLAWANLNSQNDERQAVKQTATTFLDDLTNFRPATVDADFAALQDWADPGSQFAKQAAQTFNSGIRQALIQAQGTSQGELRSVYVENEGASSAEVYAVVDQAYQNSKMTSPQSDVLRVDVELTRASAGWRVSTVTVENPSGTPGSAGSPTSAGG